MRRTVSTGQRRITRRTSAMTSSRACHLGGPPPSSRLMAVRISARHVVPARTLSETVKPKGGSFNPWLVKSAVRSTNGSTRVRRRTRHGIEVGPRTRVLHLARQRRRHCSRPDSVRRRPYVRVDERDGAGDCSHECPGPTGLHRSGPGFVDRPSVGAEPRRPSGDFVPTGRTLRVPEPADGGASLIVPRIIGHLSRFRSPPVQS